MKLSFILNSVETQVEVDGEIPLLWVLRDYLDLKGTKFGCGKAACGACTIILDGVAIKCCSYPAKLAEGKQIITIEGLGAESELHPVQQAWLEEVVPQCGYCQPGFIMASAALLNQSPQPTNDEIDEQIINICRCGTYYRMRKAIHRASEILRQQQDDSNFDNNEE